MSKSQKPTPMPSAVQAGAIDAFTEWRQSKKFVVGGPLLSRKGLKASARALRQRIAPETVKGCVTRRASMAGLAALLWSAAMPVKAQQIVVVNGVELVFLSDELQPLVLDLTALALPQQRSLAGLAEKTLSAEQLSQVLELWRRGRRGMAG
ncbi:hypothetical protein [Comamonas suwonensis]|uniref:Uncharacterized protein n=1 Tax=Comamonas suwonensis TaxID=2606214 RepID=A0A843BDF9_9BURK|nr:hypothetical protein [Comamonas suwonensis]MBI1625377.1 hypothetical protein [Comamonas suwonensis]